MKVGMKSSLAHGSSFPQMQILSCCVDVSGTSPPPGRPQGFHPQHHPAVAPVQPRGLIVSPPIAARCAGTFTARYQISPVWRRFLGTETDGHLMNVGVLQRAKSM